MKVVGVLALAGIDHLAKTQVYLKPCVQSCTCMWRKNQVYLLAYPKAIVYCLLLYPNYIIICTAGNEEDTVWHLGDMPNSLPGCTNCTHIAQSQLITRHQTHVCVYRVVIEAQSSEMNIQVIPILDVFGVAM